jgi:hypothetical protein
MGNNAGGRYDQCLSLPRAATLPNACRIGQFPSSAFGYLALAIVGADETAVEQERYPVPPNAEFRGDWSRMG